MNTSLKPPCIRCNQPYLAGKGGVCASCRRGKKPARLRCDCGKPAVAVLMTTVGTSELYPIEIPLCRDCLSLEMEEYVCGKKEPSV